jgi:hypothetical protein
MLMASRPRARLARTLGLRLVLPLVLRGVIRGGGDLVGEQREIRAERLVRLGLDDVELRVAQPLAGVDVAHERRDAGARLGDALDLQAGVVLLHRGEVGAVGQRAHQLVEHVHDLGPRALQLLDDLHARDELLFLLLEVVDLLDLLVELADLGAQALVAALLPGKQRVEVEVHAEGRDQRGDGRGAQRDQERQLAFLALRVTPRK